MIYFTGAGEKPFPRTLFSNEFRIYFALTIGIGWDDLIGGTTP